MSESEYIPIEEGRTLVMRGIRDIKREGEQLPDMKYRSGLIYGGRSSKMTFNGMEMMFMQRKRDGKIVSIAKDGRVFEVI